MSGDADEGQASERREEWQVAEAYAAQQSGAKLIDIRGADERAAGTPAESFAIGIEQLQADAARHLGHDDQVALLICGLGTRSRTLCQTLRAAGWSGVGTVVGGFRAWQEAGLPCQQPLDIDPQIARYDRQLRLPGFGIAAQTRLASAHVLVVGAGGLGSPAALYLAGAGFGRLTVVDDDQIERHNLHRQILHADADVGRNKAESAQQRLQSLNPDIRVTAVVARLADHNLASLLEDVDVVVEGSDNLATRYAVDTACRARGIPWVYGAVEAFQGQLSVFTSKPGTPCLQCLYPQSAAPESMNCGEAGVLGVVPGVVGILQATEAIKLIAKIGDSLAGRLLKLDLLTMTFGSARLIADPACAGCGGSPSRSGIR